MDFFVGYRLPVMFSMITEHALMPGMQGLYFAENWYIYPRIQLVTSGTLSTR